MKFEVPNNVVVQKEMIPQIISRIFTICKTDTNFPLRDQISQIDKEIKDIKGKIFRQNDLFKQSQELAHELNERLTTLESRNSNLKERLIESLGSEL
jgi:septal ring factor EnvC (AmiA/AmiB activator)